MKKALLLSVVMIPFSALSTFLTYRAGGQDPFQGGYFMFWGLIFALGILFYFKFIEKKNITLVNAIFFILFSTFANFIANGSGYVGVLLGFGGESTAHFSISTAVGGLIGAWIVFMGLKKAEIADVKVAPLLFTGFIIPFIYFLIFTKTNCDGLFCAISSDVKIWPFVLIWQIAMAFVIGLGWEKNKQ